MMVNCIQSTDFIFMGILNLELDVYFSEDVYIIKENQPSFPVMLITERPAFVPFDVLVHPVLSDFNATGLLFTYQNILNTKTDFCATLYTC